MSIMNILVEIKNMASQSIPFQKTLLCQQYPSASRYIEELEEMYQLIQVCTQQRAAHSNSSQILWLKDELTLLLLYFEICKKNGMKILEISIQLSKEQHDFFSKSPSVIMRMYYQLLNEGIPTQHIIRKKSRQRKRQQGYSAPSLKGNNASKFLHSSQKLKEISKHLRYIENTGNEVAITNFLNELHTLTSVAVKKKDCSTENSHLLQEAYLKKDKLEKEKEHLENTLSTYHMTATLIQEFITYSDLEQIEKIPEFTQVFQKLTDGT